MTRDITIPRAWTRQSIIFGLREAGTTVSALAEQHGLKPTSVYNALERPYPRVHALVAKALGFPKEVIWPQFYAAGGKRRTVIRRTRRAA